MNEKCTVACEPAEPKSRITAIYEQLQALGRKVFELQREVNSKRVEYYAIDAKEENRQGGIITDIERIISEIEQMVLDAREYVEIL